MLRADSRASAEPVRLMTRTWLILAGTLKMPEAPKTKMAVIRAGS